MDTGGYNELMGASPCCLVILSYTFMRFLETIITLISNDI